MLMVVGFSGIVMPPPMMAVELRHDDMSGVDKFTVRCHVHVLFFHSISPVPSFSSIFKCIAPGVHSDFLCRCPDVFFHFLGVQMS